VPFECHQLRDGRDANAAVAFLRKVIAPRRAYLVFYPSTHALFFLAILVELAD